MLIPKCNGNGVNGDHCCYLGGTACEFLRENVSGRRYACGLFLEYRSWPAVNSSGEYQAVGRYWESTGNPFNACEVSDPSFCCRPEFREGRHNQNCEPGCRDRVGV